jgi:hypothetical protein
MNKPDWKDAPEWANYLAAEVVEDEWVWCWYEFEPEWDYEDKAWFLNVLMGRFGEVGSGECTLEKRPS